MERLFGFGENDRIVIGSERGDLHYIGKSLARMMLESAAFEVEVLGVDVAPEAFSTTVKENKAHMLFMSALLTTIRPIMRETIGAIIDSGLKDDLKNSVGGAPVTQKYDDNIKADSYAVDVGATAYLAKRLLN